MECGSAAVHTGRAGCCTSEVAPWVVWEAQSALHRGLRILHAMGKALPAHNDVCARVLDQK